MRKFANFVKLYFSTKFWNFTSFERFFSGISSFLVWICLDQKLVYNVNCPLALLRRTCCEKRQSSSVPMASSYLDRLRDSLRSRHRYCEKTNNLQTERMRKRYKRNILINDTESKACNTDQSTH